MPTTTDLDRKLREQLRTLVMNNVPTGMDRAKRERVVHSLYGMVLDWVHGKSIVSFEGAMANLSGIVKQVKRERDQVEQQLSGLNAALTATAKPTRERRKMSVAARRKIAAAQRARWAKVRAKRKS